MPKPGHPLREIPEFTPEVLARLRDEFSVTTAEELVGLWRTVPGPLASFLGPERAERLAMLARKALSGDDFDSLVRAEKSTYPFQTGHDAPPSGKQTF